MRKIIVSLFVLCLILIIDSVAAVPASPYPFTLEQPDGYSFQARQYGDERVHWIETLDGYTIVKDENGWWTYAAKNNEGKLIPTGNRVGTVTLLSLDIEKHLTPELVQIPENIFQDNQKSSRISAQTAAAPSTGTVKVIAIRVNFADKQIDTTAHDLTYFTNLVNGSTNSLRHYFDEVSYGNLNIEADVATYIYDLPHNLAYYGDNSTCWVLLGVGENPDIIPDAMTLADSDVDFSNYDSVMIYHAGLGEESSQDPNDYWSMRWAWTGTFVTFDGKIFNSCIVVPENESAPLGALGVTAHEFGHEIGAPDLYDYDYDSNPVSDWDLMASGSWNNNGNTPAHMGGYLKWDIDANPDNGIQGWLTPTTISTPQTVAVDNLESSTGNRLFKVDIPETNQYFLVENRQNTGYDSHLPDAGILIWHIDEDMMSYYNTTKGSWVLMNDGPPWNPYFRAWVEDPGGTTDKSGAAYSFNDGQVVFNTTTSPDSGQNDGTPSGIEIYDIGAESTSMSVTFGYLNDILPIVVETSPANQETNVEIDTNITARFSEPMNSSTLNNTTVKVYSLDMIAGETYEAVEGYISYNSMDKTVTFDPVSNLTYATNYISNITTGAEDLAGNHLKEDYKWVFKTKNYTPADTVPPNIIITSPVNNSILNSPIITILGNVTDDFGIICYSFDHECQEDIYFGEDCFEPPLPTSITINQTVTLCEEWNKLLYFYIDESGNSCQALILLTLDTIRPNATAIVEYPKGSAANNGSTITLNVSANDSLGGSGINNVTANVSAINASGLIALSKKGDYWIGSIVVTATDGNHYVNITVMDNASNVNFTEINVIMDNTPPEVNITEPANLEIDVDIDTNISATFNESMNSSTLNNSTVKVYIQEEMIAGETFEDTVGTWNSTNFGGFILDEELAVQVEESWLILEDHMIYSTQNVTKDYLVYAAEGKKVDESGNYSAIGWMGDEHVVVDTGSAEWLLTNVIFEQNITDTKTLQIGESWDLGEGYSLKALGVDVYGSKAIMALDFSGEEIKNLTVNNQSPFIVDVALGAADDTPILVTYLSKVNNTAIQLKYTWLISQDVTVIYSGTDQFHDFDVDLNDTTIMVRNDDDIGLMQGATVSLFGDLMFEVEDETTLRYRLVRQTETPVEGDISYDSPIKMVTFNPVSNLTPDTTYISYITTGAEDLAGNGLVDDYIWEFNTILDTTPPVWAPTPSDQTAELGVSFSYDVNAIDLQAIAYSVNDTINFSINPNTGLITNNTILSFGVYGLNITAADASGNSVSQVIIVTVQDTTEPVWITTPSDQNIELGASFNYDIDAADLQTITYGMNDTINFSINPNTGLITNNTILSFGVYGLNITAADTSGNSVSQVITVTVQDTTEPVWITTPSDQNIELGASFNYDIDAADLQTITYGMNDTTNFSINPNTGLITNNTILSFGVYGLNITAADTSGNSVSQVITVTVQDTTEPVWITTPSDQNIELGVSFNYDIDAADLQTITYGVNDTTNFSINPNTGLITNNTILSFGVYGLNITAADTSGNSVSQVITVTVQDTTEPVWITTPSDQNIELGVSFNYDIDAADLQTITYGVNDTTNFSINPNTGLITNNTILSFGVYGLNITAADTSGNSVSQVITVTVQDTTEPVWITTPSNQNIELGVSFNYDIDAADLQTITYGVNDTTNFSINPNTGLITNNTILSFGVYGLNITAADTSGNSVSQVITVTVHDTTPPAVTNLIVTPQLIYINNSVNITVDVMDADQVTVNASITYPNGSVGEFPMSPGSLYSLDFNDTVQYGIYDVTIIAKDQSGNENDNVKSIFTAASQFTNQSIDTTANVTESVDAYNETQITLEFVTNENVTQGTINITRSPANFTNTSVFGEPNLGIYVDIDISQQLEANLSWFLFKIFYNDDDVVGFTETSLSLHVWNETSLNWDELIKGIPPCLDTGVNAAENYIWANVTHLSIFTISASPSPSLTPAPTPSKNGGGRSSGGGSSGEDFYNIVLSETDRQSVFKNSSVSFIFDMEGNIVKHINFTALNSGGTIAAKVEILNNTSTLVSTPPPDEVYKNLNIWVGNFGWATETNMADTTVSFTVEKSWVTDNNIDETTISLNRYSDNNWDKLVTRKVTEDSNRLYFEAETLEFSPFAVTGKKTMGEPGGEGIIEPTVTAEKTPTPTETKGIPGFSLFAGLSILLIAVQLLHKKN